MMSPSHWRPAHRSTTRSRGWTRSWRRTAAWGAFLAPSSSPTGWSRASSTQLETFGLLLPLIFLLVAAFILNVALARTLALQRTQIAALKALGYGNAAIGWHYIKWALLIGILGAALGVAVGAWLGAGLAEMYNQYFRFPLLIFSVPLGVVAGATVLTLGTACAGAFHAVRRAVRVPPAEAMRPETPALYKRSVVEVAFIARRLGTAGRMVVRNLACHPFRAAASVFGISLAVAILMVGLIFVGAMERLIATQFWVAERQDVTVTFVEPRSGAATLALARVPGVMTVEPQRVVAARIRAGHRDRYLAVTGVAAAPRLRRIVDRDGRAMRMPPDGLVLSRVLADALDVRVGDEVRVEALEGARPVRDLEVTGLVNDVLGLFAYMDLAALHAMMREGPVTSGALLLVDPAMAATVSRQLKTLPVVAAAGFKRAALQSFRDTLAAHLNLTILVYVLFAAVIAFGVVYNAARVSLSERSRELASLRVLGFTRAEISLILLGELALLTLAALPGGWVLGSVLSSSIADSLQSEVYRFPLFVSPQAIGWASLATIAAALLSGLIVRSRLDRLDLVAVLKVGE